MAKKQKPVVEPVTEVQLAEQSKQESAPIIEKINLETMKKQTSRELVKTVMDIILSIE